MWFLVKKKKKQGGWLTPPSFDEISLNLDCSSFGWTPSNWPSFIEIGEMACASPAWSYRGCALKNISNKKIEIQMLNVRGGVYAE